MKTNQIITLRDTRDDNDYEVVKLNDGKCWMTQNLKLGSNQSIQLAPSNSNLSTAFELPSINSLDGWGSDNNSHYLYIDNNLGGYYSWTTVTAKTTVMNEMSYNSICPKGWHLPTSYEWMALKNSYPAEDLFKSPPNLSLSGKIYNRQISEQNQRGYYWTASEGRPDYPLYIQFYDILNNNQEYFGANMSYTNKYEGYSVRCIAGDSSVENYSIQYSSNGGSPSSIKTTTGSAPLSAYVDLNEAEPQRSGYIFWGWCTTNPGLGEECSGKRYRKIYPLADGTNVKLYAMWHTPCNSTGATMKDGKCWNTVDSATNTIWNNPCSGVWHMPSPTEYQDLIDAYNNDGIEFAKDWGSAEGSWWANNKGPGSCTGQICGDVASFLYLTNYDFRVSSGYTQYNRLSVRCVSQ